MKANVNMKGSRTRKKVAICNVIIAALCVLSIVCYLVLPFWKVDMKLSLTAEKLEQLMEALPMEDDGADGMSKPLSATPLDGEQSQNPEDPSKALADLLASLDFQDLLGDSELSFEISIVLKSDDIISAIAEPEKVAEKIVQANTDVLVEQVNTQVTQIVETVTENLLPNMVNVLLDYSYAELAALATANGYDVSVETIKTEIFTACGITTEWVIDLVEDVQAIFEKDTLTAQTLTDDIFTLGESVFLKGKQIVPLMVQYGIIENNGGDLPSTDEEWDAVWNEAVAEGQDDVYQFLLEIETEYGALTFENLFMHLIAMLEEEMGNASQPGGEEPMVRALSFALLTEETPEGGEPAGDANGGATAGNAQNLLATELTNYIMSMIPAEAAAELGSYMQYLSYFLIAMVAIWAYPIVKILFKMGAKNNTVKLGVPIWLGSLPFLLLQLLPMAALFVVQTPSILGPLAGNETANMLAAVFSVFNIRFTTGAWVAFAVGTFFVLFSIFYYGRQRRKLKKMKKGKIPVDAV